jgi:hypothetical protein
MEWFKAQNASGFEKNIMARGLIEGLIQTDLNAATRLATTESDPELKGQFFDAIARQQLKAGGAQATKDWISRLLAGGTVPADSLAGTAGEVADRLARADPKAATTWAMSLPEGESRNNAMEESIRQWGRSDPTAASEYLTRMPASDAKDRAVQDFSRVIAAEDPKSAVTWAASIADPGRRERAVVRAAQEWHQKDPQAALQWAATSGLSAEAQQRVTQPPENRGRGGGGWNMRGRR